MKEFTRNLVNIAYGDNYFSRGQFFAIGIAVNESTSWVQKKILRTPLYIYR